MVFLKICISIHIQSVGIFQILSLLISPINTSNRPNEFPTFNYLWLSLKLMNWSVCWQFKENFLTSNFQIFRNLYRNLDIEAMLPNIRPTKQFLMSLDSTALSYKFLIELCVRMIIVFFCWQQLLEQVYW